METKKRTKKKSKVSDVLKFIFSVPMIFLSIILAVPIALLIQIFSMLEPIESPNKENSHNKETYISEYSLLTKEFGKDIFYREVEDFHGDKYKKIMYIVSTYTDKNVIDKQYLVIVRRKTLDYKIEVIQEYTGDDILLLTDSAKEGYKPSKQGVF